jgi:hypothetical protein
MPVPAAIVNPPGNPEANQEYVPLPPVAVRVVDGYAILTVPTGNVDGAEIASTWLTVKL